MAERTDALRTRSLTVVQKLLRNAGLEWRMLVLLIVLAVVLTFVSPYFLTISNLSNVMDQSVVTGIVAIGQTFVILTAGIDLSVGSLVGLTGIVLGLSFPHFGIAGAILAAVVAGGAAGFVNGAIITKGRVAAFVVTLGMMSIARSQAYVLSGANSISSIPPAFGVLASGALFGLPINFIALVALYAAAWLFLTRQRRPHRLCDRLERRGRAGRRTSGRALQHLDGKTPPKQTLVPIIVVSKENIDQVLPTIKQTVFANQLK